MALTQDQIAELFRKNGFVFDINNPVSLERYTIMDKVGDHLQPTTLNQLNQLNQHDPVGFAEKLEQHLRDGNVICYDTRATYQKATAISLNEGSDTLQMAQYDTVPTPPVAAPQFLRLKRIFKNWVSSWKTQVTQYDNAVRLTEQRTAQVQHFENQQTISEHERATAQYEMLHQQSIMVAEAYRGEQLQPMPYPEKSLLREKYNKVTGANKTADDFIRQMNYHHDRTFDKDADEIYKSAQNRPFMLQKIKLDEKKLRDYEDVLKKRPESYKNARYAEFGGFVSSLIPPAHSQEFYSVLMDSEFSEYAYPNDIINDYKRFLGDISTMVDESSQKNPNPHIQNRGVQRLWERCNDVSQDIMQKFEEFQHSLDSTIVDRKSINSIPVEDARYTSANLTTLKLENLNPQIAEFLNKNSPTIKYLKELVTTVASNSSVITEENRKVLDTCNTLSVQMTRMTEAIRKGNVAIELRLEDSSKLRDTDFQLLLESPEIKKAMQIGRGVKASQNNHEPLALQDEPQLQQNEPQLQQNEPHAHLIDENKRIELLQKEYNQFRKAEVENYKKEADEFDTYKTELLIRANAQLSQNKMEISKPNSLSEINDQFQKMFTAMGGIGKLEDRSRKEEAAKSMLIEDNKKHPQGEEKKQLQGEEKKQLQGEEKKPKKNPMSL